MKKIQVISNINREIIGTGIPEILPDDGEAGPKGCTILAGEGERVDLVQLTPNIAKLSASEMFRRCSLQGETLKVSGKDIPKKSRRKR